MTLGGDGLPMLPCGHHSFSQPWADGNGSCAECGAMIPAHDLERLIEGNRERMRLATLDTMQAGCAHVLQTVHFDGDVIDRITCDACNAELPLPEPAPIKPPRRMLQPTKDQLRETIKALEGQVDELRHTIEAMNAETEAALEAFQRLWAETRPTGLRSWWASVTAGIAEWWNRPKQGGLTSFEIHDMPSREEAMRVADQHLRQSMRPRERLIPITITATGLPTEETRNAAKALANSAHRQVAPDPDHPQGQGDSQAQPETAQTPPAPDRHPPERGHQRPAQSTDSSATPDNEPDQTSLDAHHREGQGTGDPSGH